MENPGGRQYQRKSASGSDFFNSLLGQQWRDHPLKGDWQGTRECHVGGDFLLIYQLGDKPKPGGGIVFLRAGTHSELFGE